MRLEPVPDRIVLSKEDYQYYQQRRKDCKVYDPEQIQFKAFNPKKRRYIKK